MAKHGNEWSEWSACVQLRILKNMHDKPATRQLQQRWTRRRVDAVGDCIIEEKWETIPEVVET